MIEALKIRNFKGFAELDLPRLSRFTIIGGGNNTGKSSILEAISLYCARLNPAFFLFLHGSRGLAELPLDPYAIWAPFFCRYDWSRPIVITPRIGDRVETLTLAFVASYAPKVAARPGLFGIPTVRADQFSSNIYALNVQLVAGNKPIQKSHFVLSNAGINLEVEQSEGEQPNSAFIPARSSTNTRDDAMRYGQLDVINASDKVLKFLTIVEPDLKGISLVAVGGSTILHGEVNLGRKIPIYNMGDGVVRLLNIILFIATCRNGIVMIDEFGNGLHHTILSRITAAIFAAAKEYNVQIISTTHSYECLQEAHKGLGHSDADDFTYIRLDRVSGVVSAKTYDYKTLGIAIEQGREVR